MPAQILYKFWFSTNTETAVLSKDCRKLDFWGWINIVIMSFQVFTDCLYLIFVTNITNEICGEKSVMWKNSRFLYMTNVEKSAMWRNSEFLRILSRFALFCVEKKLEQNYICGEKMTHIRYAATIAMHCVTSPSQQFHKRIGFLMQYNFTLN